MIIDTLVILSMSEIIFVLKFESEMSDYFEVTSKWHEMPGKLSDQPGFQVLGINFYFLKFIVCW